MTYTENFTRTILDNSLAILYHDAISEWSVIGARYDEQGGYCICGKNPIHHISLIHNNQTDIQLEVGSVCINKFGKMDVGVMITRNINKIHNSPFARLEQNFIDLLLEWSIITADTHNTLGLYSFMIGQKKKPTQAMWDKVKIINTRIVSTYERGKLYNRTDFTQPGQDTQRQQGP